MQVSLLVDKGRFSCFSKKIAGILICKLAVAVLWLNGESCASRDPSRTALQPGQVVLTLEPAALYPSLGVFKDCLDAALSNLV